MHPPCVCSEMQERGLNRIKIVVLTVSGWMSYAETLFLCAGISSGESKVCTVAVITALRNSHPYDVPAFDVTQVLDFTHSH